LDVSADGKTADIQAFSLSKQMLGNPVEGERDSGLKPNTIPL